MKPRVSRGLVISVYAHLQLQLCRRQLSRCVSILAAFVLRVDCIASFWQVPLLKTADGLQTDNATNATEDRFKSNN